MNSSTKEKKLREIARKVHLLLESDASGTMQDWRDVVAESLSVIDTRSADNYLRLARVNLMIEVVGAGGALQWRRGRLFDDYLHPDGQS